MTALKVAVLVGEASGDQLAASIISALKSHPELVSGSMDPDLRQDVQLCGVGGPLLAEQGLQSLFDYTELSLMGIVEIVGKYGHLLNRVKQTVQMLKDVQPDIVLSVDAPEFAKAVVKRARKHLPHTRFIHTVAPTVWAWRPGRAKTFAKLFDRLLCLFPFEPPYFEAVGLKADFIGHPAVQDIRPHAIEEPPRTMLVLPGSRRQEVNGLLPVFIQSIQNLVSDTSSKISTLKTLTLPHIQDSVAAQIPVDLNWQVTTGKDAKRDMLATGDVAMAASGTMGLELALAGIPHIIAYKLHPVSHFIIKRMARTPYAHLANIILQKPVVPELLQDKANVENCTAALGELLNNAEARNTQIAAFNDVRAALATKKPAAEMAAGSILDAIKRA